MNDRRTTQGVFHVAEGGLPIPSDKIPVPLIAYAQHAARGAAAAAESLSLLPFTANWAEPVETMVSLLLRPLVCPAVPGVSPEKRIEVRFFAPGGLVSNLDFVESIFGNAGDPVLARERRRARRRQLDRPQRLRDPRAAPHPMRKKDLGLPHVSRGHRGPARARHVLGRRGRALQRRASLQDHRAQHRRRDGDDPRRQLLRLLQEGSQDADRLQRQPLRPRRGRARRRRARVLDLQPRRSLPRPTRACCAPTTAFSKRCSCSATRVDRPRHRLRHRQDATPRSTTCPRTWSSTSRRQDITWTSGGEAQHLKLLPGHIYIHPSGYKVRLDKHPAAPSWRLVGTVPEGTFCHKPCTVSGGGKSEISKSLVDAVLYGSIYVQQVRRGHGAGRRDLQAGLLGRISRPACADDSSAPRADPFARALARLGHQAAHAEHHRLHAGVQRLAREHPQPRARAGVHHQALLPPGVGRRLARALQRRHHQRRAGPRAQVRRPQAGRQLPARRAATRTARGAPTSSGRISSPADKVQMEDDITASVVVPADELFGLPEGVRRPPEPQARRELRVPALPAARRRHPPRPRQADREGHVRARALRAPTSSRSARARCSDIAEDVAHPRRASPSRCARTSTARPLRGKGFSICSANPRIVDGKPSKNPRYLQVRPDMARPRDRYVAEMGARLYRQLPQRRSRWSSR